MLPLDILELPMAVDVLEDLSAQPPADRVIVTLVGAYAIDALTGESTFHIGHPRLNRGGGGAWYWRVQLGADGYGGAGRGLPASTPGDSPVSPVPDAPVRLRPSTGEKTRSQGSE